MPTKQDWSLIYEDYWQLKDQDRYDMPCSLCGDIILMWNHTDGGDPICENCETSDPFALRPEEFISGEN